MEAHREGELQPGEEDGVEVSQHRSVSLGPRTRKCKSRKRRGVAVPARPRARGGKRPENSMPARAASEWLPSKAVRTASVRKSWQRGSRMRIPEASNPNGRLQRLLGAGHGW